MDAFSTDPSKSLGKQIQFSDNSFSISSDQVDKVFETDRICKWISNFSKVSLQFPDHLLRYAPSIVSKLGPRKVHVLGDTSYSPCCVDVVAAQHLGADALVHFGEACLSSEDRTDFPILYVYTQLHLNPLSLNSLLEGDIPTLIVYDVGYSEVISNAQFSSNILLAKPSTEGKDRLGGRVFPPYHTFERIVYCGTNSSFLLLIALSLPDKQFFTYNPKAPDSLETAYTKVSKLVMKRYVGIEKAKDATRIGILMGTLSTQGYLNSLDSLRSAIVKSGKRPYSFLVGKPNPAKLANFPEIDIFVYISCPQSVYAMAAEETSKDYFQPVISPFELEMALNNNRSWEGNLCGDFEKILPGGSHFIPFEPKEGPDVSLLSGRIRLLGSESNKQETEVNGALLESETRVSELHRGGGGGSYLASRTWRGLEQKLGESEIPSEIVEGRKGIASHYEDEPK
ncbi:2-(3-amino-3-carboxypropyl)histidine synthase subunit 2 [Lepeophtheirus salmonis]|uniref:2-(3-amino-3-carboxypropyl)histidine synthase subunit 2 n=1 Tax=Lepeophtheirus salmonis TaxID=72036 RepID=UPI001AE1F43D|nr:2-(3-amino-3-carboxypropyl)histidine synthase subunit 2-like [Lepeophtheirus salmonis]